MGGCPSLGTQRLHGKQTGRGVWTSAGAAGLAGERACVGRRSRSHTAISRMRGFVQAVNPIVTPWVCGAQFRQVLGDPVPGLGWDPLTPTMTCKSPVSVALRELASSGRGVPPRSPTVVPAVPSRTLGPKGGRMEGGNPCRPVVQSAVVGYFEAHQARVPHARTRGARHHHQVCDVRHEHGELVNATDLRKLQSSRQCGWTAPREGLTWRGGRGRRQNRHHSTDFLHEDRRTSHTTVCLVRLCVTWWRSTRTFGGSARPSIGWVAGPAPDSCTNHTIPGGPTPARLVHLDPGISVRPWFPSSGMAARVSGGDPGGPRLRVGQGTRPGLQGDLQSSPHASPACPSSGVRPNSLLVQLRDLAHSIATECGEGTHHVFFDGDVLSQPVWTEPRWQSPWAGCGYHSRSGRISPDRGPGGDGDNHPLRPVLPAPPFPTGLPSPPSCDHGAHGASVAPWA